MASFDAEHLEKYLCASRILITQVLPEISALKVSVLEPLTGLANLTKKFLFPILKALASTCCAPSRRWNVHLNYPKNKQPKTYNIIYFFNINFALYR